MKKALSCGILASLFFAVTFVLNSSMNISGGYWMWSACLRYILMLPLMALLLGLRPGKSFAPVLAEVKRNPGVWILWSTVGFGLFYLPLTLASVFGESWLVAASWQITIVAGVLLTPLFGKKIPVKNLLMALVILAGIFILQLPHLSGKDIGGNLLALIPIVIAAFSYPLGNRKMMEYCPEGLDTVERVFGMTLCSMPFWLCAAILALANAGFPSGGQVLQSAAVALFSGVVATLLFFYATDLVKENPKRLAIVEATQSGEVVFTLLGGVLLLGEQAPDATGLLGLAMILVGMICNSFL